MYEIKDIQFKVIEETERIEKHWEISIFLQFQKNPLVIVLSKGHMVKEAMGSLMDLARAFPDFIVG